MFLFVVLSGAPTTSSTEHRVAHGLATGLLEQAVQRGPDNRGEFTLQHSTQMLSTSNDLHQTKFNLGVKSRRLNSEQALVALYEVTVQVHWRDKAGPEFLSAEASRTISVKG